MAVANGCELVSSAELPGRWRAHRQALSRSHCGRGAPTPTGGRGQGAVRPRHRGCRRGPIGASAEAAVSFVGRSRCSPPLCRRGQGDCARSLGQGRRTTAALGVPAAGPADPLSFMLANRLVGNVDDAGTLEATGRGPILRCLESTFVAVVGASPALRLQGQPVEPGRVLPVAGRPATGPRRSTWWSPLLHRSGGRPGGTQGPRKHGHGPTQWHRSGTDHSRTAPLGCDYDTTVGRPPCRRDHDQVGRGTADLPPCGRRTPWRAIRP